MSWLFPLCIYLLPKWRELDSFAIISKRFAFICKQSFLYKKKRVEKNCTKNMRSITLIKSNDCRYRRRRLSQLHSFLQHHNCKMAKICLSVSLCVYVSFFLLLYIIFVSWVKRFYFKHTHRRHCDVRNERNFCKTASNVHIQNGQNHDRFHFRVNCSSFLVLCSIFFRVYMCFAWFHEPCRRLCAAG